MHPGLSIAVTTRRWPASNSTKEYWAVSGFVSNQNGSPEGLQEPLTRWSTVPAAESESVRPPLASGLTLAVALPLPLPLDPDAPAAGVAFARLLVPAAGVSDGRFTAARGGT